MLKIFSSSSKFWNAIVVSSSDPNAVALTVKGFFSIAAVQMVFNLLSYVGIHPTFTLDMLGTDASSIVYSVLMAVSYLATAYGILRKWIVIFHGLIPAKTTAASGV